MDCKITQVTDQINTDLSAIIGSDVDNLTNNLTGAVEIQIKSELIQSFKERYMMLDILTRNAAINRLRHLKVSLV